MDTPFPYDKFVTGKNFIGRKAECTVLSNLIAQHEHVVLYEPPKAGKTSLVQQAMYSMRYGQRAFTVGQFSVLNIRTVDEFLARFGSRFSGRRIASFCIFTSRTSCSSGR